MIQVETTQGIVDAAISLDALRTLSGRSGASATEIMSIYGVELEESFGAKPL